MAHVFYENFDLHITSAGNKTYEAAVYGALGGDSKVQFSLEGAPEEVLTAIGRNFGLVSPPPANGGNGAPRQVTGKYLFETVFDSTLLASLQVTLDRAKSRNANLRLRLNLTDTPELVGLPWEMIASQTNSLALAVQTSVVRYQNVASPSNNSMVQDKPLRMLVVISNPAAGGMPALDVEKEFRLIKQALKPLEEQGLIQIECWPVQLPPTLMIGSSAITLISFTTSGTARLTPPQIQDNWFLKRRLTTLRVSHLNSSTASAWDRV